MILIAKYKFSSFYDLTDVLYFNREQNSPRTALLSLIPDRPVHVLDLCAGTGSNSLVIAKNKAEAKITALDLSVNMLTIADKKIKKGNIKNIELLVADACNTGFENNTFDVILLSLVLHEIAEDLRQAIINEAKRILRYDGKIIVIEWKQPVKLFQRLMFFTIKSMEPTCFKAFLYTDQVDYFHTFGLKTLEIQNCDYTQVFALSKR